MSDEAAARFVFDAGDVHIARDVSRAEFAGWIAPELAAMEAAVDEALAAAGLDVGGVDRVFLTGGASLTPA
ncbi:Hsp70 family protein, partial [Escherichia coli]|uniref:Hsp70 family protein n=1 Tax=Escherichia coli TaxID=562 RepID=UPI0028DF6DBA